MPQRVLDGSGWLELSEIASLLDEEQSTTDLRRYFSSTSGEIFTGSRFESLGGDRQARYRDEVTAEDLVAVEMLGVRLPPLVAIDLLEGPLGRQIGDALREIPTNLDLSDEQARPYVVGGGPADRAWHLLTGCHGVGRTIAGKVLARKRPRLLPIYDSVVACALRGRSGFWLWLHEQLRADDLLLTRKLRGLRTKACFISPVRAIRR